MNLSRKIGLVLAGSHLFLFTLAAVVGFTSKDGQAGMVFIPFLVFDFFLLPLGSLVGAVSRAISPVISFIVFYGVMGTVAWYFIPIGFAKVGRRFNRK